MKFGSIVWMVHSLCACRRFQYSPFLKNLLKRRSLVVNSIFDYRNILDCLFESACHLFVRSFSQEGMD